VRLWDVRMGPREAAAALGGHVGGVTALSPRGCVATGRGLHSSTSQLNLGRFWHKFHLKHPLTPANTSLTPPRQPLHAPPIP
jgi:hypothetical protein